MTWQSNLPETRPESQYQAAGGLRSKKAGRQVPISRVIVKINHYRIGLEIYAVAQDAMFRRVENQQLMLRAHR